MDLADPTLLLNVLKINIPFKDNIKKINKYLIMVVHYDYETVIHLINVNVTMNLLNL